jgi:hypothetical protein
MNDLKLTDIDIDIDIDFADVERRMLASMHSGDVITAEALESAVDTSKYPEITILDECDRESRFVYVPEGYHELKIVPQEPTPVIPKRAIATYRRGGKSVHLAALLAASLGSSGAAAYNQLFGEEMDTEFPKYKEKTLEDVDRLAKAEQKRARKMARRKA